jgi:hypothetical protein
MSKKLCSYFDLKPANWSVLSFLRECELEPFETKIDSYIKQLKTIVSCDSERDDRKRSAQLLLDKYQKASLFVSFIRSVGGIKWRDGDLLGSPVIQGFLPSHETDVGATRFIDGQRLLADPTLDPFGAQVTFSVTMLFWWEEKLNGKLSIEVSRKIF